MTVVPKRNVVSAGAVPEDIQKRWRNRFRAQRLSRGMKTNDFETIAPGGISHLELHDISTLTLGKLYLISQEMGMGFVEMTSYLFRIEDEDLPEVSPAAANISRLAAMTRSLDNDAQKAVLDMVRPLVDYLVKTGAIRRPLMQILERGENADDQEVLRAAVKERYERSG